MIKKQNKILSLGLPQLLAGYLITLLLFVLDRILKFSALNFNSVNPEFNGFFNFKKNFGIAFSIPIPQVILYLLVIAILILLVSISVKYLKQKKYSLHFITILVIFGAVSNIIDRIKFGFVVDYIDLKFWPVFNLADVMIIAGVCFWVLSLNNLKKK